MNEQEQYEETYENNNENRQNIPYSDLQFNFMTTDPAWGKEAPTDLWNRLQTKVKKYDTDGTITEDLEPLWGLLGFYTRDIRLGNLGVLETLYCQMWFDIAGDLLTEGYTQAFFVALRRPITVLELSQSKNGFVRKLFNKRTVHQKVEQINPSNRGIFGGKKGE